MEKFGNEKLEKLYDDDSFREFSIDADGDKIAEIIERKIIVSVLEDSAYIVSESARNLGISKKLLIKKMKEYNI